MLMPGEVKAIRDGFGQVSDEDLASLNAALVSQQEKQHDDAAFRARLKRKMEERYPDLEAQKQVTLRQLMKARKTEEMRARLEAGGLCHCGEWMIGHSSPLDCGHSPVRLDEPDDPNDPFWNAV